MRSILYNKHHIYNKYFIWFDSQYNGMLMGDIELCNFTNITLEQFDKLTYEYSREIIFPYKHSGYRITYFTFEKDIQGFIGILESYLVIKILKE